MSLLIVFLKSLNSFWLLPTSRKYNWPGAALPCTTLHYNILHHTALPSCTLPCTALHCFTLHDNALHCSEIKYTSLYCRSCASYTMQYGVALHYIAQCFTARPLLYVLYSAVQCSSALHCTA